jgi:prepilin-type N-terminal cleavage/methylation domain-containing protein
MEKKKKPSVKDFLISKKFAFTLAEVLITLGVIGVVAAITMPTLIGNYKKTVLATQTKKVYSTWSQALKLVLAKEEVSSLSQTSMWSLINSPYAYNGYRPAHDIEFWNELSKYIKITTSNVKGNCTFYKNDTHSLANEGGENLYAIYTPDGTIIKYAHFYPISYKEKTSQQCDRIKALGGKLCQSVGEIRVDVNGKRGPNTLGRDVHQFIISDDGTLYPRGGKDWALYDSQTALSNNQYYWKTTDTSKAGQYATGRLVDEGWKMNY